MYEKTTPPKPVPAPAAKIKTVSEPFSHDKSGENEAYAKVRRLIESNRVDEALTLARSRHDGPMKNAQGVCLMRKGLPAEAIRIYRALVLDSTGLFLRSDAPMVYKTNYALALLLSGHAAGGINILKELAGEEHPSLQNLRSIIAGWKSQLSFLERLGLKVGLEPSRPVVLDSPPGELV